MASPEFVDGVANTRFTPASRAAIEKKGYLVYQLTGRSIRNLREEGKPFFSTWHKDFPEFECLPSLASEIALNPRRVFLPDSHNRTDSEQEELVSQYSGQINRISRVVRAFIGHAPDYAELYFAHLEATGEKLFGETGILRWARTGTTAKYERIGQWGVQEYRAIITNDEYGRLVLDYRKPLVRDESIFVIPLIVPREALIPLRRQFPKE